MMTTLSGGRIVSPCRRLDCVKSLRSSYTGLYDQTLGPSWGFRTIALGPVASFLEPESGPPRAVHLSRHTGPGGTARIPDG